MNKYLSQLIELSKIDKEIDDFFVQEAEVNKNLQALQDQKESLQSQFAKTEQDIKELKEKKKESDGLIKSLSQKLKENEKKNSLIKNEKELKALQLEEGIAKERINEFNDDIERIEKVISNKEEELKATKDLLSQTESKIKQESKNTKEQLAKISEQKDEVSQKRKEHLKDFPQKLLSFYQKIRSWAKSSAVVPVKKGACYGCYMKLNDRVYSDLLKSEEIINCPHCGRILYINQE